MKNELNVVVVTDHSISMRHLSVDAMIDFNRIVKTLRNTTDLDIILTHIGCSSASYGKNEIIINRKNIDHLNLMTSYRTSGNTTPLMDAVLLGMSVVSGVTGPVLMIVITDGEDNASVISESRFADVIREANATDRYTITFSVPKGSSNKIARLGIHPGNIQEWDQNSVDGLNTASFVRASSISTYASMVASGSATSSNRFYANLDDVSSDTVKKTLRDISQETILLPVSGAEGQEIRKFVESRLGRPMKKGAAFYQLMKTESQVQDYKILIIRDKTSNALYSGDAARTLLNVPKTGTIKLSPGRHGNYDIFIQSTSVNRKLDPCSQVIYWENVGVPYQSIQAPAPVQVPQTQSSAILNAIANAKNQTSSDPINIAISAAKKAVPAKKAARVRNRNTVQEQIRRTIRAHAKKPVTAKQMTNYLQIEKLGITNHIDHVNLFNDLCKFNSMVSFSDFFKAKVVGDWVSLYSSAS